MKLRIVQTMQQNPENSDKNIPDRPNKEHQGMDVGLAPKDEEDGLKEKTEAPLNPSPISAYDPLVVCGKRKRKLKEMLADEVSPIIRRKKKQLSGSQSKDDTTDSAGTLTSNGDTAIVPSNGNTTPVPEKTPTMIRAEEVQLSLGKEHPSFLKTCVRSHVAKCFWLGIPVPFAKLHLPDKDTTVILEGEDGEEYRIKYIAYKTGLSAGWGKFVTGTKLVEGDVLIFQLIGPCRFKVYVIRANNLTEVDGALSLLILDSKSKRSDAATKEGTTDVKSKKKRRPKSFPLIVVQKKKKRAGLSPPHPEQPEQHSGNDSDEVASEVLEISKLSGSAVPFKDVMSFEQFHTVVNGVCIDSELPEHIRQKYYELCCSKKYFLHDRLLPGLYSKLAAAVIVETVNTADAIRTCKLTTPKKEFEVWEKSLRSFELLGLNVGFLRARLHRLQNLAFDSDGALDTKKYWEAKKEQSRTEDEIRNLEAKLLELKEASARYDIDVENLRLKAERHEHMFQEEAGAPW